MISFQLRAVGELARNPELCARGEVRFCLVGQDDAAEPAECDTARETVTHLWFSAFGDIGARIAHHARKGARLFVEARVVADIWIEKGERQCAHTFIVTGVRFGARDAGHTRRNDECAAMSEASMTEGRGKDDPL